MAVWTDRRSFDSLLLCLGTKTHLREAIFSLLAAIWALQHAANGADCWFPEAAVLEIGGQTFAATFLDEEKKKTDFH
jgi:hypothetical protein